MTAIKGSYQFIELAYKDQVTTIWLNRPEVRNAFHEGLIGEIIGAFREADADEQTRIILLRGKGKSFCAGADLNWMKNVAAYSYEENLSESLQLSECFKTIYNTSKPTIAYVHGAAMGGANGLIAACDMAYADTETTFSLSEVKIGVIPACIGPYIIKRIGEFSARELMITGRRFSGLEAADYKLINKIVGLEQAEAFLAQLNGDLLQAGPKAVIQCKKLIHNVCNTWTFDEAYTKTAKMIATIRSTPEAQEGMAAFLEKRKPNWMEP